MNRFPMLFFVLIFCSCGDDGGLDEKTSEVTKQNAEDVRIESSIVPDSRWDTPPQVAYIPQLDFENIVITREDNVHVMLRITAEGIVDSAWIRKSLKYPELDSLSITTAYRMVFTPAKRDGKPIATEVEWPFVFRNIDDEGSSGADSLNE